MAALSKAFRAVGATPSAFPTKVRDKLLALSLLYGENDSLQERQRQPSAPLSAGNKTPHHDNKTDGVDIAIEIDMGSRVRGKAKQPRANRDNGIRTQSPHRPLGPLHRETPKPTRSSCSTTLKHKRALEEAFNDIDVLHDNLTCQRPRKNDALNDSNASYSVDVHNDSIRQWVKGQAIPHDRWKWGPGATSQMAAKFYDAIYHIPRNDGPTLQKTKPKNDDPHSRRGLPPSPQSSEKREPAVGTQESEIQPSAQHLHC